MTPTEQQAAAVVAALAGEPLKIQAGAGCGKTSTLKLIAEALDPRSGLFVAFNRGIVDEARTKMPHNVEVRTFHSLAYGPCGIMFRARMDDTGVYGRKTRITASKMAQMLGIDPLMISVYAGPDKPAEARRLAPAFLASQLVQALRSFSTSADPVITARHFPRVDGIDEPDDWTNNRAVAEHLMDYAAAAWADVTNPAGQLRYDMAFYVKQWQLGLEDGTYAPPRVDFVMCDEAQDLNPVYFRIAQRIADYGAQLIAVGDSEQQVNAWNGAVDALDKIDTDPVWLTQSFRFGHAVAAIANTVLDKLPTEMQLIGTPAVTSTIAYVERPDCELYRTNAGVIKAALGHIAQGRRPYVQGGTRELVALAEGALELQASGRTDHPQLCGFLSWEAVCEYVNTDATGEDLKLFIGLISQFGAQAIITGLQRASASREAADVTVSTAHKAKGLEWPTVRLGADFSPTQSVAGLRLLYVAATRARKVLDITSCPAFTLAGGVWQLTKPNVR